MDKNRKPKVLELTLCGLFTALIAVGAFIKIPLGPIPFTLQTFFVVTAGMLLGSRRGAVSALVYMLLGLIGVPIFTEGGGFGYVFKPTFGYIIGFIIGAFIAGLIVEKDEKPSFLRLLAAGFAGLAVIYAVGMVYVYLMKNFYLGTPMAVKSVIIYCFLVFLPGDGAMCVLAAVLSKRLRLFLKKKI